MFTSHEAICLGDALPGLTRSLVSRATFERSCAGSSNLGSNQPSDTSQISTACKDGDQKAEEVTTERHCLDAPGSGPSL